jgi:hypothetical protein
VFDDEVPVLDCRSEDLFQHNVRVHCANVFPLWAFIDVLGCVQTLYANDAVGFVDVYEGAISHLEFHEVIDPLAKLGGLGSLLKQVVMISDVVSDRSILVVE